MPDSLKLADFLDEEFLALMVDLADFEGWVSTQTIAESIPIATRNVGCRLGWLRRYGVVERDLRVASGQWRLTETGEALVKARFNKTQQTALSSLRDDQLWALTGELAGRYETVDRTTANLVRRRFTASTIRRRYP